MQPLLVHYCDICTYNTTVPFTASVFSQPNSCSHCGAVSNGINVRSKVEEERNMQQEELARLFQANLSLTQAPQYDAPSQTEQIAQEQTEQQQQPTLSESTQQTQPITYASTHYTHSYHVAPARHSSAPPKTQIDASELEAILMRNSIDASLLFPSQIDLFQNADDDQRLRLLELWRISPPQGRQGYPAGVDYNTSRQVYDWPPTNFAQEEAMAKLRYEKLLEEKAQSEEIQNHQQQLDQSMDGGADSVIVQETRDILSASPEAPSAEPYILSGYDMLARREYEDSARSSEKYLQESNKYNQATDPVFNHPGSNNGLWEKNVGSIMNMENSYGAFIYARDHGVHPIYADDEMVM